VNHARGRSVRIKDIWQDCWTIWRGGGWNDRARGANISGSMRIGWRAQHQSHKTYCKKAAREKSIHEIDQHDRIIYIELRGGGNLLRRRKYFERHALRDETLNCSITSIKNFTESKHAPERKCR